MHVEHSEIAPHHIRLTLNISKEDYMPAVEKSTKDLSKNIVLKGFRKGMVPQGMVKKMHGTQILVEELNKRIDAEINNFIKENNFDILGRPLATDDKSVLDIDINSPGDFVFDYELGLVPPFEIKLPARPINYLEVTIDENMLEEDLKYLRNKYGNRYNPETIGEDEKVMVTLLEVDSDGKVIDEGINTKTQFAISAIKDNDIRSQFIGKATGDNIEKVNIFVAFGNDENDLSTHILKVNRERLGNASHFYNVAIDEVFNIEPAAMDKEFFGAVYPGENIDDEATFRERRKEDLAEQFTRMSNERFGYEAKRVLMEEADMTFPLDFLKKLVLNNKHKSEKEGIEYDVDDESLDSSMPGVIERLKWDLLSNKIARENDITITPEELLDYMRYSLRGAYLNYNMDPQFDGIIDNMARKALANEETKLKKAEELLDMKIIDWLAQRVPRISQPISAEEFYNQ